MKMYFAQISLCAVLVLVTTTTPTVIQAAESPNSTESVQPDVPSVRELDSPAESIHRVSLEVARDRAQLLHDVYASTLDVMHHRYFHTDRAIVPARAMEDIFDDMKAQSHSEAHWIAVSLKAMSIHHEPKTEFDKRAVAEIKSGQRDVEVVEEGYYRRAVAIPLTGGCISCHEGLFPKQSASPKFAGLVISIPVRNGEQLTPTRSEPK